MDILSSIFMQAVGFSALAVVLVLQVLKFKFIPWNFVNKYPVPSLILASVCSSIVVVWRTAVQPQNWIQWAVLIGTIVVTSALTYNTTLRNWSELRATEGSTE